VLGACDISLGGHNMAVKIDTLSGTKWRICVLINIDRLAGIERAFLITIVAISGGVLAIGVILFAVVARTITKPMKMLEIAMLNVEQSDYFRMEEVDIVAFREIDALIKRFNKMMYKIDELMKRVIDEQEAQRKSELKALQNQINPHFLYNTLDSIIWLIENEKNPEAAEMVIALAKLFRIGVSGDSEVIKVRRVGTRPKLSVDSKYPIRRLIRLRI
jgi:two-component system sensor histidine kinase YesM